MQRISKITLLVLVFLSFLPGHLNAAEYFFNPNFIITDEEMTDYESMTLIDIQNFLERKGSSLAYMTFPDFEGIDKRASEIIWQAAQESFISPKVILATLQKEQSLIGDAFPSQGQYDKAMGYRCPDGGSCNPRAAGFGKQVDGAVWQFRKYYETADEWFYKIGEEYDIDDGGFVTPVNQATANLYNYTPHNHGNKRFWQIWQDYFGKDFPDGSLLKSYDDPTVWVIQYGGKRHIESWGALVSRFDPNKIITVSPTDLDKYETGHPIKFYNYSLLGLDDGRIYLIVDDTLRLIESLEVFRSIGFNPEEIELVEQSDLAGYKFGANISLETTYPTGALLQDDQSGGVYFVQNGVKQPIYAKEIMQANFKFKVLTQVSPEILEQYPIGLPVKFKDGELIKVDGESEVYVISDGKRVWIKTADAFANLGYKWDNIITTSKKVVNLHPLGKVIE